MFAFFFLVCLWKKRCDIFDLTSQIFVLFWASWSKRDWSFLWKKRAGQYSKWEQKKVPWTNFLKSSIQVEGLTRRQNQTVIKTVWIFILRYHKQHWRLKFGAPSFQSFRLSVRAIIIIPSIFFRDKSIFIFLNIT